MKSHYLRFKKWIEKKKIQRYLNNLRVGGIIALGLLFIILVIGLVAKDSGLILGTKTSQEPVPTIDISNISASESPTPTSTPIPKPIYIAPAVDHDPIIDCVGPDGKHLQVTQQQCDAFISAWRPALPSQQQNTNTSQTNTGTYISTNYPPCTVHYSASGDITYSYTSPETCKIWQDQAKTSNTVYAQPTQAVYITPIPTIDQQAIDYRITLCKNACISSAEYAYTTAHNQCRANNTLGSSFCKLPSTSTLINNCYSNCK